MFEHLEHMDDELSVAGQRHQSRAASRSALLPALLLAGLASATVPLAAKTSKAAAAVVAKILPQNEVYQTLLVHAVALMLAYAAIGPLFRFLSLMVLRAARQRGLWVVAQAVYLNGILLHEERACCSILCAWGVNFSWWSNANWTRRLLSRPCVALLLLLLTSGLRKLLEFAFLTSKLRTRFEADVLTNAFERAAWLRLADLPLGVLEMEWLSTQSAASDPSNACGLHLLPRTPLMPDIDEPHVFERRTAEMLRTAFCSQEAGGALTAAHGTAVLRRQPSWQLKRSRTTGELPPASFSIQEDSAPSLGNRGRAATKDSTMPTRPAGVSAAALKELLSSTTTFLMQVEGRFDEIEAKAHALFRQLVGDGDEWCEPEADRFLRMGLEKVMPKDDAERTWQMLVCTADGVNTHADWRGNVSAQEFVAAFRATFERFHIIAATVKDYAGIWFLFSDVLAVVQAVLTCVILLALFFPPEVLRTLCIGLSTAFLGLSFVFGGLLREMFESVVHILVMNPYDVGDRIRLQQGPSSKIYTVQKINILTTEVRDLFNQTIYFKNAALFQGAQIVNMGRSLNAVVELGFDLPAAQVSNELVAQLKEFVRAYLTREAATWVPAYLRAFCPMVDGTACCDLSGAVTHRFRVMHRTSWQNVRDIRQDVTLLLHALLGEMRRLDLDFRLPTQPVQLEGLGALDLDAWGGGGGLPVAGSGRQAEEARAAASATALAAAPGRAAQAAASAGALPAQARLMQPLQEASPGPLPRQASYASDITEAAAAEAEPCNMPARFMRLASPV